MITPEQWQALHDLPLNPGLDAPELKPLNEIYGIKKVVRTDELGLFEMEFIPGGVYGFIAVEENYLGIRFKSFYLAPNENRIGDIPVMKLYPAATVLVTLQAEERISVNPKWIIDTENNPFWVSDFLAADDRSESMFTYDKWLEQNQVQSFHIPAGLNVQITLQTPYHDQWCPIEIPDIFNLEQGQVVDLGSFTFEPAIEVYVQAINSQGEPVEGIPVRTLVDKRTWGTTYNSDESGISMFYVIPGSKVEFGVSYRGEDGTIRRETIPCEVKGREDAGLGR